MRISIFGLGYVGAVTAACLARDGHHVIGVDVNAEKVAGVAAGRSPIVEEGLDELLASVVADGRIEATTDARAAVAATDVSMITVGTPPLANGEPDLEFVMRVCGEIAAAVKGLGRSHVVVLRSTVPPGTLARCAELFADRGRRRLIWPSIPSSFARARRSATTTRLPTPSSALATRSRSGRCASCTRPCPRPSSSSSRPSPR